MQRETKPLDLNRGIQHKRLGELNRLIRDCWLSSEELAAKCRQYGSQAVTERILCGQYLNEMKGIIGHGKWTNWLDSHRPEISTESARRAMRMAKQSRVTDLTQAKCITDAYRICGILPDPEETEQTSIDRLPAYQTAVRQVSKWRTQLGQSFKDWPAPAVDQLRTELAPIVQMLWPGVPIASQEHTNMLPRPPHKESFKGGVPSGG